MVSKNNRLKRFEQAAQRDNHFGIRKLTIGAASVLLGTSLFLGTQTSSAKAATEGNNNADKDKAADESGNKQESVVEGKNVTVTDDQNFNQSAILETQDKAAQNDATVDTQASETKNDQKQTTEEQVASQKEDKNKQNQPTEEKAQTSATEKGQVQQKNDKKQAATQAFDTTAFKTPNFANGLNAKELAQLFGASFIAQPNSSAVDLANYKPNVSYTDPYNGSVLNTAIPQGQYAYAAAIDKGNHDARLVWTIDKNNPGNTIYFWVNGRNVATISKSDRVTKSFQVGIRNSNDPSFYQGGDYAYDYTRSKGAGYQFNYNNVQGLNGTKVDNGISGNINKAGSNILFQKLDGSGTIYQYNPTGTKWSSASALAPTQVTQHIYYVNAETGEIMAKKSATGLSGQKYDLTNAAPETVTWNGQELNLVDKSQASDAALNKVLATNNGVDIIAKNIADAEPQGKLGSFRPGNIYASVLNFGQGVLFIDKGRNNAPEGTTDSNAYNIHVNDQRMGNRIGATGKLSPNGAYGSGGLSSVFFKPGDETGGAVNNDTGTAMNKNLFTPGNQDIVFFYKGEPKKPDTPVTPPETQKGSVNVIFHDITDNKDIPGYGTATGTKEAGTPVGYAPGSDLITLEGQGYEYVNQVGGEVPTTIPNGNKTITINLQHGVTKSQEAAQVSRNIYYQGKDTTTGVTTPVNGSPNNTTSYTQTAHFTREVTKDNVTKEVTKGAWQSPDNIMPGVPSAIPSTIGYESVDKPLVGSLAVTDPSKKPEDVIVTYTKASKPEVKNVNGKITYIDDTTGHTLQQDNFTPGEVGTTINYSAQPSITSYQNQGYKLVSNNFGNGKQFKETENNPGANNYEVHLVHDIKPETETAQSTAHVHYIISDGKVPAPADSATQTINWNRTNQVDQVTGKTVSEGNWIPNQPSFNNVASPSVKNYTPDQTNVSFDTPVRGKDQVKNVVYYPNAKPADENVNGKQIVHYVDGDNNNAKLLDDSINDTTTFNKHDGVWNETSHKYNDANAPVINGYVAEHRTYTGNTATPQDPNKEITIVYHKIGRVIPVDKTTGTPIPGEDHPQYPNDPTDPTKVNPGTKPNVPNYKPETGKPGDPVKPNDPTKDTKVPYVKNAESQNATFEVYDRTDNNKELNNYAADGMPKTNISFSGSKAYIDALLKQGYVIDEFVNDKGQSSKPADSNLNFNTYDNDTKTTQDFKLYLVHGTKAVKQTAQSTGHVHYIISDGKVQAPADSATQTINWTKTDTVDQVTGKTVKEGTWTKDKDNFSNVTSPKVTGYTPDKTTASFDTPVRGKDQVQEVIYTPNAKPADQIVVGKQIVHYVDGDNNNAKLLDDNINDTTVFNQHDGKWDQNSHKYQAANAPVINGYVAEKKTYEGQTGTPQDPNKEITIVYHKIGKIIPVDPSGKPIPDAPTPEYKNDPNDPTKVTPNLPTPNIPDWTTDIPDVTPEDPTKDTKVPYTKPEAKKGSVTVVFHDDTDNVDLPKVGTKTGTQKAGTPVNYTPNNDLTNLENQGYVYVSQDGNIPSEIPNGDKTITIHVKHGLEPITPENPGKPNQPINPNDPRPNKDQPKYPAGTDVVTKDITRTIHYEGADQYTPDDASQTVHFEAKGVLDKVTGQWTTPLAWSKDQSFNAKKTPIIPGYHVVSVDRDTTDNKNVDSATVSHTDSDYKVIVKYAKDEAPKPVEKGSLNVIFHDDTDNVDLPGVGTTVPETEVGTKVTYKSQPDLTNLENKGYVYVPTAGDQVPTEITKGHTTVTIHVKHGVRPVTPENPADPNKPSDPTKPQTPTPSNLNLSKTDLEKQITRDVTYVYTDGKKSAQPVHQVVNFHGEGNIDTVTGNLVNLNPDGSIKDQRGSIKWNAESQDFKNVPAIDTTGYQITGVRSTNSSANVDRTNGSVSSESVTPNSGNVAIQITLSPKATPVETTNGSITYIDDVTGDTLENANFSGAVGTQIPYTTANRISYYEGKGYKEVSNDFKDGSQAFDKDAKKNIFTVHLTHATVPVDPQHPGYGYDKTDLDKTITRDVVYQYEDGSQADTPVHQDVHFRGEGTIDKVTGQLVTVKDGKITGNGQLNWTPEDGKFDTTKSIDTTQYRIVKIAEQGTNANVDDKTGVVSEETVTPKSNNSKVVITLAKKQAPVEMTDGSITYIDDVTGQTLQAANFGGQVGSKIDYTTADKIASYEKQGYKLVSNDFTDGSQVYNKDAKKNVFTVHLTHATVPVDPQHPGYGYDKTDLDKTVTREVVYQYEDGSQADTPVHQDVHFRGEGTIDKVTGQLVTVKDGKITGNGQINWNPEDGKFDTTKSIDTTQYRIVRISESNTSANVDQNNGVVSEETVTPKSNNSKVVITLAKKQAPVAKDQVAQVIYRDLDENNRVIAQTNDMVGKSDTDINYSSADTIKTLEDKGYVLVNNGYDPEGKAPKFDNDENKKQVFYIDLKHGTRPVTPENPADPNKPSDPTKPQTPTPSNPNLSKEDLNKTITRTIEYKYADGTTAHESVVQNVEFKGEGTIDTVTGNLVNLNPDGSIKDQRGSIKWNKDSESYAEVPAIDHAGYYVSNVSGENTRATINDTAVSSESVTPNSLNGHIVITLTKSPEVPVAANGSIKYIDDTTNTTLANGSFSGQVGNKIPYTTADQIAAYEKQGYKLVSNNFSDGTQVFDKDTAKNTFEVHLVHDTVPVNPEHPGFGYDKTDLDKTITREVVYQYEDGSQAETPVKQTVNFHGQGVVDKVTGQFVTVKDGKITGNGQLNWTPEDGKFDTTKSIDTDKYEIVRISESNTSANVDDKTGVVAEETVTPKNQDSKIVITLAKKQAPVEMTDGSITYIDDVTGQTLQAASFGGQVGSKINYTTADKIASYENQGYKLVSNDFTDGSQVYNKDAKKNVFTVHLTHTTSPVDPQHPGHGYDKSDLDKTITRTVEYVYSDGAKTLAPVTQEVHFEGHGVIDNVTGGFVTIQDGKIIPGGSMNWTVTPGNSSYAEIPAIDTTGYYISGVTENGTNANVDTKTGAVAGEKVGRNNVDSHIVITLTKKPEVPVVANGDIVYIDDTTGETLQSSNFSGNVGDKINYTTADKIASYEKKGYELVSNNFNDGNENFAKDGNHFEVHLKHTTEDITPNNPDPEHGFTKDSLTKTGTQTITYVGAGNQTPGENTSQVNFEHTLVIDKVTGKVVKDNGWSIVGDNYKSVATPEVKDYTPDKTQAGGVEVTVDSKTGEGNINTHYVVTYTKNPETPVVNDQKAQVRYLDQDEGNKEITKSDVLTGKAESTINYSTAQTIEDLENKGYELVYDGFSGKDAKFDNDDNTTQVFDVILKHKHTTITPKKPGKPGEPINPNDPEGPKWENGTDAKSLTKTGTQTVKYVGAGEKTPNPSVTNIEFNHSITYDNVTGKVVKDNGWTPDTKSYTVINTPNVEGYTADKPYAGGETVNVNDNNINREYTVTYTKNPETPVTPETTQGKVSYIDDTTGKTLDVDNFNGNVGDKINYTTGDKISNFESQGYELVSNNFNDGNETFAKDGNNFEVHLKHGTKEVTPKDPDPNHGYTKDSLTKTGTQTVIYTGAGKDTPAPNTTHVEFEHTLVIDKVNGNIVKDNGWTPATQTYTEINTPEVKDYTPDKTVVGGETVNVNGNIDKTYVVTYTKNPETPVVPETPAEQGSITVTVHDTTTGQDLPQYGKTSGKQDVGTKFNYDKNTTITDLTNKGYKVINSDVTIPGNVTKGNQNVVIYVEHDTTTITPNKPGKPGEPINPNDPEGPKWENGTDAKSLTKTGTQTVKYEGAGEKTPDSKTTHVEFEHSITYDKVTGKVVKDNGWTPSTRTYTRIDTPEVEGYTADKSSVGGDTVNVNDSNINREYTVTYTQNNNNTPEQPTPNTPEVPSVPETEVPDVPAPHGEDVPTPPSVDEGEDIPAPHGQDIPTDPAEDEEPETVMPHAEAEAPKAVATAEEETVKPHAAALPQTGAKEDNAAAVAGLALIGLVGLAGAAKRRRQD